MAIRIGPGNIIRNSSPVTLQEERYPRAVTREEFDALLNRVVELEKQLAGNRKPAVDRAAYMREYRKRRKADSQNV